MITTLSLPMPGPLKHINSYVIRDGDDTLLIDTGLPIEDDAVILKEFIEKSGYPDYVLITHYHPDHIGQARLFKKSRILLNQEELQFITDVIEGVHEREMKDYLLRNGFPENFLQRIFSQRAFFKELLTDIEFEGVKDGDKIVIGSNEAEVIWTPGHTVGHSCVKYGENLFCGDHILPNVTPNVSLHAPYDDPLGRYLNSLDKIEKLEIKTIYPAHGEPFTNVKERIEEIKKHHFHRLQEIIDILEKKGRVSAFEIAMNISWYRKWDELSNFDKQLAMGETMAHIKYLLYRDKIKEINDGTSIIYTL
ncbi:beta-lactamase [Sulfolobus acidocaldarius SUSAZ]|nr:beta-lactamase [Sulfolobus acidocaldarius SUSAZ]